MKQLVDVEYLHELRDDIRCLTEELRRYREKDVKYELFAKQANLIRQFVQHCGENAVVSLDVDANSIRVTSDTFATVAAGRKVAQVGNHYSTAIAGVEVFTLGAHQDSTSVYTMPGAWLAFDSESEEATALEPV